MQTREIYYAYPMGKKVSFAFVAEQYIDMLSFKYKVWRVSEESFYHFRPLFSFPFVIHPVIYFCLSAKHTLNYLRLNQEFLIGFEVADTDRISQLGIDIVNYMDLLIVPSRWCKEVYLKSGLKVPCEVVPHALSEIFYRPKQEPYHPYLKKLKEIKKKRKLVYGLFFLWHSGRRKGAHLVAEVYKEIIKTHPNFILIIKIGNIIDPHLVTLTKLGSIVVKGWLNDQDLLALYDMCDIYLLFSLGGGWELNGIEALARGEIVLGAEEGSWTDYLPREFQIPVARKVKIFTDGLPSQVHVGCGVEIDIQKAVDKLHIILDNLDEWKAKAEKYAEEVKRKFSKETVGKRLLEVFDKYLEGE